MHCDQFLRTVSQILPLSQFLKIFSAWERASVPRNGEGRDLRLIFAASRLTLSHAEKNAKEKLWDHGTQIIP